MAMGVFDREWCEAPSVRVARALVCIENYVTSDGPAGAPRRIPNRLVQVSNTGFQTECWVTQSFVVGHLENVHAQLWHWLMYQTPCIPDDTESPVIDLTYDTVLDLESEDPWLMW